MSAQREMFVGEPCRTTWGHPARYIGLGKAAYTMPDGGRPCVDDCRPPSGDETRHLTLTEADAALIAIGYGAGWSSGYRQARENAERDRDYAPKADLLVPDESGR